MPFTNEVIGTNGVLIRNWLQSANYVAGTSGWQITKAGNAEFNNGTFRGSLTSGSNPGQHVILNNPATGDAIDVYNSSNTLVYNVNNQGAATSYNPANTNFSVSQLNAETSYGGLQGSANAFYTEPTPFLSSSRIKQVITQVVPNRGNNYELDAYGGSVDATQPPTLVGTERNVTGSIVQSDQVTVNNLQHAGYYVLSTNASGQWNQAHNCSFTPTGCIMTQASPGVGSIPVVAIVFSNSFTNTNFVGQVWNGSSLLVNTTAAFFIQFFG